MFWRLRQLMQAAVVWIRCSWLHVLLQLAGFVVNLDTREQVQKLQREVRQCTDGLSSLQHHLETGFAEVKDKIDDSQDRYTALQIDPPSFPAYMMGNLNLLPAGMHIYQLG